MENRRKESDRGSTSNREDYSSRSEITNLPTHAARRANLRFTGIDPDTWEQDPQSPEVSPQLTDLGRDPKRKEPEGGTSQYQPKRARRESPSPRSTSSHPDTWGQASQSPEVSSQKSGADPLLNPEPKRPDEGPSVAFPQIIEKIHPEVQKQIEQLINSEREDVSKQKEIFSSDELRETRQKLFASFSQAEQVKNYLDEEMEYIVDKTLNYSFKLQRAIHQKWVASLPEEYQEEQLQHLINEESENLLIDTEDLDFEEQREKHQNWVNLLPQAYQREQSLLLLCSERKCLFNQTRPLPFNQRQKTYQTWFDSVPQEYQAEQPPSLIDSEMQILSQQIAYLNPVERGARFIDWVFSVPQEEQHQVIQILREQDSSVSQQLIEQFEQEDQRIQQHYERVQTIIREENLGIDAPDQKAPEWSNFAANLIVAYEEKHGLGNSRILGDILQGGTGQAHSIERNGKEYKELMIWVLRKWKAREQYREIERTVIQNEKLSIERLPDRSTQEWADFATNFKNLYKEHLPHDQKTSRILEDTLEDIIEGGIHEGARWNVIRSNERYKNLMIRVLSIWRDHIRRQGRNNA
jgi:hypothetical protein